MSWSWCRSRVAVPGDVPPGFAGWSGRQQVEPAQGRVQIRAEFGAACLGSGRKCPHYQRTVPRQGSEACHDEVPQSPGHPMPHHRVAHGLADHETGFRLVGIDRMQHKAATPRSGAAAHDCAELVTAPHTSTGREHVVPPGVSGGEPLAAPAATSGHDGAAGASPHAQPEPVGTRAAAVVRLEGALALAHG